MDKNQGYELKSGQKPSQQKVTEHRIGEEPSEPAQKGDAISAVHLFVSVFLLVTIKETILGGSMPPPEIQLRVTNVSVASRMRCSVVTCCRRTVILMPLSLSLNIFSFAFLRLYYNFILSPFPFPPPGSDVSCDLLCETRLFRAFLSRLLSTIQSQSLGRGRPLPICHGIDKAQQCLDVPLPLLSQTELYLEFSGRCSHK